MRSAQPTWVKASRIDNNTWKIEAGGNAIVTHYKRVTRFGYVEIRLINESLYKGLDSWGSSTCECVVVDKTILVSVDLTTVKPVIIKRPSYKGWRRKVGPLVQHPLVPPPPTNDVGFGVNFRSTSTMPSKQEIRRALEVIAQVEAAMPLKLVRRKDKYEFVFDAGC